MDKEFYDIITQEGKFYLKAYITSDVDHKKHQPFWSGNKRGIFSDTNYVQEEDGTYTLYFYFTDEEGNPHHRAFPKLKDYSAYESLRNMIPWLTNPIRIYIDLDNGPKELVSKIRKSKKKVTIKQQEEIVQYELSTGHMPPTDIDQGIEDYIRKYNLRG